MTSLLVKIFVSALVTTSIQFSFDDARECMCASDTDPCSGNTCPAYPDAKCKSFCCYAIFYDEAGLEIRNCTATKECAKGLVFNECGSQCTPTCSVPRPMCKDMCVEKCECPPETPLLHDGKCINAGECPSPVDPYSNHTLCDNLVNCFANPCDVNSCPKYPEAKCKASYCGGCIANFYNVDGQLIEDCVSDKQCPKEQVYKFCGSACERTCEETDMICTEQCVQKCECPDSAPILHNGHCINRDRCPTIAECEAPRTFDTCASRCVRTCSDPYPMCTAECVGRCACPAAQPIEHDGECIAFKECPMKPEPECFGGQKWNECGMDCIMTCENPTPMCTKQCVPKCQCPKHAPFWETVEDRGYCVSKEQCAVKEECVHKGEAKEIGDSWQRDPCTTCTCMEDKTTGDKTERCDKIYCAMPICKTEVIYPEDQCCPSCAEECSYKGVAYDVGASWDIDPCTSCWCYDSTDTGKSQECYSKMCDIPICSPGVELKFSDDTCCPYCGDECTHKGEVYEMGDGWELDECTHCKCYENTLGRKTQECASLQCSSPHPDCNSTITIPGQCCPTCLKPCTYYDEGLQSIQFRKQWKPDQCTVCNCNISEIAAIRTVEECVPIECADLNATCGTGLIVHVPGECCPVCLKPCYTFDGYDLIYHDVGESWKRDACTTCECMIDAKGKHTEQCMARSCVEPDCPSEDYIQTEDQCCSICKDECTYNGVTYEIKDSWKEDKCITCSCTSSNEGNKAKVCAAEDCLDTTECKDVFYRNDSCCAQCLEPCTYINKENELIEVEAGAAWNPDPCTFCSCDTVYGVAISMCAVIDCARLEDHCVPVYNDNQCCPVCGDSAKVCNLKSEIENGRAVSKHGSGKDFQYIFECDSGYWFQNGDAAYCNKDGESVYPICQKVNIFTKLVESKNKGMFMVNVMMELGNRTSKWGLLCDDGFKDAEADIICKNNGYKYGRAVSLTKQEKEEFALTTFSCTKDSLKSCSANYYDTASLPCQNDEVAGTTCFNAPFEYISSNFEVKVKKQWIHVKMQISAFKYGAAVYLKKGVFKLNADNVLLLSNVNKMKPANMKIAVRGDAAYIKMKTARPTTFIQVAEECFHVKVLGPSIEFDHETKSYCLPA